MPGLATTFDVLGNTENEAAAALLLPARLEMKLVFGLRAGDMQLDRYDALSALFYRTEAWKRASVFSARPRR